MVQNYIESTLANRSIIALRTKAMIPRDGEISLKFKSTTSSYEHSETIFAWKGYCNLSSLEEGTYTVEVTFKNMPGYSFDDLGEITYSKSTPKTIFLNIKNDTIVETGKPATFTLSEDGKFNYFEFFSITINIDGTNYYANMTGAKAGDVISTYIPTPTSTPGYIGTHLDTLSEIGEGIKLSGDKSLHENWNKDELAIDVTTSTAEGLNVYLSLVFPVINSTELAKIEKIEMYTETDDPEKAIKYGFSIGFFEGFSKRYIVAAFPVDQQIKTSIIMKDGFSDSDIDFKVIATPSVINPGEFESLLITFSVVDK